MELQHSFRWTPIGRKHVEEDLAGDVLDKEFNLGASPRGSNLRQPNAERTLPESIFFPFRLILVLYSP